ncbi:hypothetical protein V1505DRAFT_374018 [Lipomyces doorenjongii]
MDGQDAYYIALVLDPRFKTLLLEKELAESVAATVILNYDDPEYIDPNNVHCDYAPRQGIMMTDAPPSVKDRPGTIILQTGSDFSPATSCTRFSTRSLTPRNISSSTNEWMATTILQWNPLASTTLTIRPRCLSTLGQVSPIVEMKLVRVFSNWPTATATALEPFGTILQAEFPHVSDGVFYVELPCRHIFLADISYHITNVIICDYNGDTTRNLLLL